VGSREKCLSSKHLVKSAARYGRRTSSGNFERRPIPSPSSRRGLFSALFCLIGFGSTCLTETAGYLGWLSFVWRRTVFDSRPSFVAAAVVFGSSATTVSSSSDWVERNCSEID
jgi:hypothetical protein